MTISEPTPEGESEPVFDPIIGFTGNGQQHTLKHKPGQQYAALTWQEYLAKVRNPTRSPVAADASPDDHAPFKAGQAWVLPSLYRGHDARSWSAQETHGLFVCLMHDDDGSDVDLAACVRQVLGDVAFVVHHTYSDGMPGKGQRRRVIVPLDPRSLPAGATFSALNQAFGEALEALGAKPDKTAHRRGQVSYFGMLGPCAKDEVIVGEGPALLILDDSQLSQRAEQIYREESEKRRSGKSSQKPYGSPIWTFNSMHDPEQLMLRYGWQELPNGKWKAPGQTALGSTIVYPDGGWNGYGDTLLSAPVGNVAKNQTRSGDALDLVVWHELIQRRGMLPEAAVAFGDVLATAVVYGYRPDLDGEIDPSGYLQAMQEHGARLVDHGWSGGQPLGASARLDYIQQEESEPIPDAETNEYSDDEEDWEPMPIIKPATTVRARPKRSRPMDAKEFYERFPADDQEFPILNPAEQIGGLWGRLADYIDYASTTNTTSGGTIMALSLLGAVIGPRVSTAGTQTRTNMHIIATDESGQGKSVLAQVIEDLLDVPPTNQGLQMIAGAAYLNNLRGPEDFHSASGLHKELANKIHPGGMHVMLCVMDEYGRILQETLNGQGASHKRAVVDKMTKVFSKANSVDKGVGAATKDAQQTPIPYPHFNLLGFSVGETFWSAYGSGNLIDGSVARNLVFPLGDAREQDENVVDRDHWRTSLAKLVQWLEESPNPAGVPADPFRVPWGQGQEARRMRLRRTMAAASIYAKKHGLAGAPAVIRRVAEMTAKIALVSAVSRAFFAGGPVKDCVIDKEDFDLGQALSMWSAAYMIRSLPAYMAVNERDAETKEVVRFVEDGGSKGQTSKKIHEKFDGRLGARLKQILEGQQAAGVLLKVNSEDAALNKLLFPTGGRRADRFLHKKFIPTLNED